MQPLIGQKLVNMDLETGIHYGIIPQNAEGLEWIPYEEFFPPKLDWPQVLRDNLSGKTPEARSAIDLFFEWVDYIGGTDDTNDYVNIAGKIDAAMSDLLNKWGLCDEAGLCDEVERVIEGAYEHYDGPHFFEERDGDGNILVSAMLDSSGDVWVFKSDYMATCGYCSLCAPNAGYLLTPGSVPAYAPPPEWFAGDPPRPPIEIFKVKDWEKRNEEIIG